MPSPKICREHAWKCIRTAETLPPGERRQRFLAMAEHWANLAANMESLEAQLTKNQFE